MVQPLHVDGDELRRAWKVLSEDGVCGEKRHPHHALETMAGGDRTLGLFSRERVESGGGEDVEVSHPFRTQTDAGLEADITRPLPGEVAELRGVGFHAH